MNGEQVPTAAKSRFEAILAGTGGQGLVLSGMLLSEAAILDGKNTVQTQSYGIASRGGLSLAEVIIDVQEILFQQVEQPDVVLALSAETLAKYAALANQGVPVFYDSTLAGVREGANLRGYPFTRIANDLGLPAAVNIVSLGAVAAACGMVRIESLEAAIAKRFKAGLGETNIKALHVGIDLIQDA